jgi:ABC-2 type transport system permease protein
VQLYLKYFSIHLRSAMQYKASFFLTTLGQFLTAFSVFLGIYFMFSRFNQVEGFTFNEVLLCFAVVLIAFSFAETFVRGFDAFRGVISNGEFDRIMVRPRNEMFQVLATKIEFTRLGRLLEAVVILVYAVLNSGVVWTTAKLLTLGLMIAGGVALFSGLFIIYASICFFTIEGLEFMNIFTDGGREFGRYPMVIYGEKVLRFFTYIVPLACVQYYPLMYLLGRTTNPWSRLAPLAGFVFLIPCYALWKFGVRHYKSTGS